jgi:hypothetical protein
MTKPDLNKIRSITRRYDELPPVELRKLPPWYFRPLTLLLLTVLLLIALALYLTSADGAEDSAKPHFSSTLDKQIATMDLSYCWFAVFHNRTTGLSHTLTTAKDSNGRYCDR